MSTDPLAWTAARLSARHVADYKPFTMVDGPGVRCALYVSGCPFACDGCFNRAAWSFRYGRPFDDALAQRLAADLQHEAVQGLSLLGGEPFLNTEVCLTVVDALRAEHGVARDVWCWTGYRFEELVEAVARGHEDKARLLMQVDVLVDGRFELARRDLSLAFRGSSNQRLVDVSASLARGEIVPWTDATAPGSST